MNKKQEKGKGGFIMQPGKKYHIISNAIPGVWNKPREMIFTFIDENEDTYRFSARPKAGTQDFPKEQVAEIREVDQRLEIMLPRIYRG